MKNKIGRNVARLGKMKGAIGVLEGDLKARDARRRQKDNVWEERTLIRVSGQDKWQAQSPSGYRVRTISGLADERLGFHEALSYALNLLLLLLLFDYYYFIM